MVAVGINTCTHDDFIYRSEILSKGLILIYMQARRQSLLIVRMPFVWSRYNACLQSEKAKVRLDYPSCGWFYTLSKCWNVRKSLNRHRTLHFKHGNKTKQNQKWNTATYRYVTYIYFQNSSSGRTKNDRHGFLYQEIQGLNVGESVQE